MHRVHGVHTPNMPNATKPAAHTTATYRAMILAALRTADTLGESGLDGEVLCEACGLSCADDDLDAVHNFTCAQQGLEDCGEIEFRCGAWHLAY